MQAYKQYFDKFKAAIKRFVEILKNRWVKFSIFSIIYILLFVVWTGNLWLLLGLPLIYDHCISRLWYRYVGSKNDALRKKYPVYNTIYGWVDAIVWATVVAHLVHLFIFQLYVVPTSSMEKTILTGDYLYVSKLSYGPQVPNTPVAMPFVYNTMPFSNNKSYSECIQWDYHRLKGRGKVERNDVVVFNYPAGDTLLLEHQAANYYDVLAGYQAQYGEKEGRRRLYNDFTIISRPVDKRENYIKRCVAIPGDTLQIVDNTLYVNRKPEPKCADRQLCYIVRCNAPLSALAFSKLDITEYEQIGPYDYKVWATASAAEKIRGYKSVESIEVNSEPDLYIFPHNAAYAWSQSDFGPLWVPKRGATVELTIKNLPLYERIIDQYEHHDLRVEGEKIFIDGKEATSYTFAMDYFFMMGDNRHNSADSRFWGFVPEDHLVGKALFIIFSKGEDGIRWNRIGKKIE